MIAQVIKRHNELGLDVGDEFEIIADYKRGRYKWLQMKKADGSIIDAPASFFKEIKGVDETDE